MRYIEALIHSPASQYRHFVWYVGRNQHVFYDVAASYYDAFSAGLSPLQQRQIIITLLQRAGVRQFGLHLHSLFGAALNVAACWADCGLPLTVTFHDHHFLSETPFIDGEIVPDSAHIQRVQQLLSHAEILLPSHYLYGQASPYFAAQQLHVIPHGVGLPRNELDSLTQDFVQQLKQRADWHDQRFTVAAIGAIGADKGLDFMKAWLAQRDEKTQFVCLGYTADVAADHNRPQAQPQHITHGFYHHDEVSALLRAYAVDVVVFFPGIPESFCYALSDVHAACPVLVPAVGALGERVTKEKSGQLYPPQITPEQLNVYLTRAAQQPVAPPVTTQTIEAMTLKTEHYYRQHEPSDIVSLTLSSDELSELLADQLHEDNLKWELAILVRQHRILTENVDALSAQRAADIAELRNQQAHLESQKDYIDTLCHDVRTEQKENQRLNQLLKQQDDWFNGQISAMQNSLSWKITKPLRAIRRLLK